MHFPTLLRVSCLRGLVVCGLVGLVVSCSTKSTPRESQVTPVLNEEEKHQLKLTKTLGEQTLAVILVNFQDDPSQPFTKQEAHDAVFGEVANYFYESSYQQTRITGVSLGWYTLPLDGNGDCSQFSLSKAKELVQAPALADGVDLTTYDRLLLLYNPVKCAPKGLASLSASSSAGIRDLTAHVGGLRMQTIYHELGHTFFLQHSLVADCGNDTMGICASYVITPSSWSNPMMGGNGSNRPIHFNAYQKDFMGWFGSATGPKITTVESEGVYDIEPLETTTTGVKALKILKDINPKNGNKIWYYVEYRQPIGVDEILQDAPGVTDGVLVYIAEEFTGYSNLPSNRSEYLLNHRTELSRWDHPALPAGRVFSDSGAKISITTLSADSDRARVRVQFLSAPTVSITAPSAPITPAAPDSTVTLTATATGDQSIAFVDFVANGTLVCRDTDAPYACDWQVPSPAGTFHTIEVTSQDTSGLRSRPQTRTIGTDVVAPSLEITSPEEGHDYAPGDQLALSCSVQDDVRLDRIEIHINGAKMSEKGCYSYRPILPDNLQQANLAIDVVAYDTSGNTTTRRINVTVGGGGTDQFVAPQMKFLTPIDGGAMDSYEKFPIHVEMKGPGLGAFLTSITTLNGYEYYCPKDVSEGLIVTRCTLRSFHQTGSQFSLSTQGANQYGSRSTIQTIQVQVNTYAEPPPPEEIDTTAPTVPQNLQAEAPGCGSVSLSWDASSDGDGSGLKSYKVYSGNTCEQYTEVNNTSVLLSGLQASTEYSFRVTAVDLAGNESEKSTTVVTTTPACPDREAPTVPQNVAAQALSCSQVQLSWDPSTDSGGTGLQGYRIVTVDGQTLQQVDATTTSFVFNGLLETTNYSYQIFAIDQANNESAASSIASATTPECVDAQAPTVSILSPADNEELSGTVTIVASATDDTKVQKVTFFVDGTIVGERNQEPYHYAINTEQFRDGTHVLSVQAQDGAGNMSPQASVTVHIAQPDTLPPIVEITAPTADATLSARTSVTMEATANDDQQVTYVEFYVSGELVCTDEAAPYSCVWVTPKGKSRSYNLEAFGYDSAGNVGTDNIQVWVGRRRKNR